MVGCGRELPRSQKRAYAARWCCQGVTALKNEPRMLIFKGGDGGDVAKEQILSKASTYACFQGWRWRWCCQGATALENKHVCLLSRVEVEVVLPRSNHP